jgi:hypothetical protein
MAEIDIVRHVVADPSGLALLLAGPATKDLWPVGEAAFSAPQRSGLGFVVDVRAHAAGGELRGRLSLVADGNEARSTEIRLVATVSGPAARRLAEAGTRFVEQLAETARARSSAA